MANAVKEQTDKEARESYIANVGRPKKDEEKSTSNLTQISSNPKRNPTSADKAAESVRMEDLSRWYIQPIRMASSMVIHPAHTKRATSFTPAALLRRRMERIRAYIVNYITML